MPAFGTLTKPLIDSPGNATACATAGMLERDGRHLPDHGFGAVERRGIGQLRERHQVLLVLRRHEAGRNVREPEHGQPDQADVDHNGHARHAQHTADPAGVDVRPHA